MLEHMLSASTLPKEARKNILFSLIRTITVGSGITPDLLDPAVPQALAGLSRTCRVPELTAGGEFHPALRMCMCVAHSANIHYAHTTHGLHKNIPKQYDSSIFSGHHHSAESTKVKGILPVPLNTLRWLIKKISRSYVLIPTLKYTFLFDYPGNIF